MLGFLFRFCELKELVLSYTITQNDFEKDYAHCLLAALIASLNPSKALNVHFRPLYAAIPTQVTFTPPPHLSNENRKTFTPSKKYQRQSAQAQQAPAIFPRYEAGTMCGLSPPSHASPCTLREEKKPPPSHPTPSTNNTSNNDEMAAVRCGCKNSVTGNRTPATSALALEREQ